METQQMPRFIELTNGKTAELRKYYQGCYRVTLNDELFGQIKKNGRDWEVQVRYTDSGNIKRFFGLWGTLKQAIFALSTVKF